MAYPRTRSYDSFPNNFYCQVYPEKRKYINVGDFYDMKYYKCNGGWSNDNCKQKIEIHYKCEIIRYDSYVSNYKILVAQAYCRYQSGPRGKGHYRWEHMFKLKKGTDQRSKYFVYGIPQMNFYVKS